MMSGAEDREAGGGPVAPSAPSAALPGPAAAVTGGSGEAGASEEAAAAASLLGGARPHGDAGADPDAPPKKRLRAAGPGAGGPDGAAGSVKLEERLYSVLCCTVCLDLPKASVYQVRPGPAAHPCPPPPAPAPAVSTAVTDYPPPVRGRLVPSSATKYRRPPAARGLPGVRGSPSPSAGPPCLPPPPDTHPASLLLSCPANPPLDPSPPSGQGDPPLSPCHPVASGTPPPASPWVVLTRPSPSAHPPRWGLSLRPPLQWRGVEVLPHPLLGFRFPREGGGGCVSPEHQPSKAPKPP